MITEKQTQAIARIEVYRGQTLVEQGTAFLIAPKLVLTALHVVADRIHTPLADRGDRIVLGAFDGAELIGTVTLLLKLSQNQPHRAEIAKMLTRLSHRHRGVATALLREAERTAIEHGRWLLVLDTAEDEGAAGLYERAGFKLAGLIPDYAFKPYGGLTGTLIYWKRLQERAPA